MDSIGDYLYIIVFLVIIVVNILKNIKRQALPMTPDFSGNIPTEDENINKIPIPEESVISTSTEGDIAFLKKDRQNSFSAHHHFVHSEKKEDVFIQKDKKELKIFTDDNVSFETRDDARRAFIYSEIWNRKY